MVEQVLLEILVLIMQRENLLDIVRCCDNIEIEMTKRGLNEDYLTDDIEKAKDNINNSFTIKRKIKL